MLSKVFKLAMAGVLAGALLTGCGSEPSPEPSETMAPTESTAMASEAAPAEGETLEIGYIVNDMSHEWYQNIVAGAERRAEELGGIELSVADAGMDSAKQITLAEDMITQGVDILIITPVDAKALSGVIDQAHTAGIPVITESNKVEGADTFVGISNLEAGTKAGEYAGQYAIDNGIEPNVLVVGFPNLEDCRQRVEGFKAGMDASGVTYTIAQEVDGHGSKEDSLRVSTDALTANPDVNFIFGINDNSTTGAMSAYEAAGLDPANLTAIGFGLEGVVGREALLGDTPYKFALAMFPDYVGATLIDTAVKLHDGEVLPEQVVTATTIITPENFSEFYTENADGTYTTNFAAIDALAE